MCCTQQFESKLSLRSLATFLHKMCCIQQFESKLSLRSLATFLHKIKLQGAYISGDENRIEVNHLYS